MHRNSAFTICQLFLCVFLPVHSALGQTPEDPPSEQEKLTAYASQLNHAQFVRRERASRELKKAGQAAIPVLIKVIGSGNLETTKRAMRILGHFALEQSPDDDQGAWQILLSLSENTVGSRSSAARAQIKLIREQRNSTATKMLKKAGAQVGFDQFSIGSVLIDEVSLVRIKGDWSKKKDTLKWLRWLKDVDHAIIEGDALTSEVLGEVASIPNLTTLALQDGPLNAKTLSALSNISLDTLEIRYVSLKEEETVAQLEKLPIRFAINLMGTGMSSERFQSMQARLLGLALTLRQGGFLGVKCQQSPCSINEVVPGSAAEKAGLEPNDIIIQIAESKVEAFPDLKAEIDMHLPGDTVDLIYERRGETIKTKLTLGRQIDSD